MEIAWKAHVSGLLGNNMQRWEPSMPRTWSTRRLFRQHVLLALLHWRAAVLSAAHMELSRRRAVQIMAIREQHLLLAPLEPLQAGQVVCDHLGPSVAERNPPQGVLRELLQLPNVRVALPLKHHRLRQVVVQGKPGYQILRPALPDRCCHCCHVLPGCRHAPAARRARNRSQAIVAVQFPNSCNVRSNAQHLPISLLSRQSGYTGARFSAESWSF